MTFEETYFGMWNKAVQEVLRNKSTYRRIEKAIGNPESSLTDKIKSFDQDLREYAVEWDKISNMHNRNSVYRRIVDFIGEQKGFLIDIGCGNGNFVAEWGNVPALGVDLNGYCLQLAEKNLKERGFPVKRYSDSTLSFNYDKGFDVKPLGGELHLDEITLLNDDINNLNITKQALKQHNVKADIATFMLFGGNPYELSPMYFLNQRTPSFQNLFQKRSGLHLTKYYIMGQLPYILQRGGSFYLGVRLNPLTEKIISNIGTIEDMFNDLARFHGGVKRVEKIPIQRETGIGNIKVRGLLNDDGLLYVAEFEIRK